MQNNNNPLENSMRQSNILSTPSSKGGHDDDEYDKWLLLYFNLWYTLKILKTNLFYYCSNFLL